MEHELNDELRQSNNDYADYCVNDGIFGGANPSAIAVRGNVAETTDDEHNYRCHTHNCTQDIDNRTNDTVQANTVTRLGATV